MPLISIIIPVYNIDKYIARCIDSILSQTLTDYEIILVNDGSSDKSLSICIEYAKKDFRIVVISQENGGASKARNSGIEVAKGKYITFIDGDDYIENSFLEKLYDAIKESNNKMSMCGFDCVDEQGTIVHSPFSNNYVPDSVSGHDAASYIGNNVTFGVVWNKLYDITIFDNIRFPVGKTFEDELILHHLYGECISISCVKEILYHYVQRDGSKMTEKYTPIKMDIIDAYMDRLKFFIERNYESDIILRDRKKLMEFFRIAVRRKGGGKKEGKEKLNRLIRDYKDNIYPIFCSHTLEEWLFIHWPKTTMQIKSVYMRIFK